MNFKYSVVQSLVSNVESLKFGKFRTNSFL